MARIKPQTLLLQSKRKKGPSRISFTTIILCGLIVVLFVLSFVITYRHWSRRAGDQIGTQIFGRKVPRDDHLLDSKKYDLPGYATLNTSKGSITVELHKEYSPEIVDKFLDLCQKGYFSGAAFHRVIKHYVIEAGNLHGIGAAEDWTSRPKPSGRFAISPKHDAFMLGTFSTKQDSKGFELFITTAPIPDLNDKLVVFGKVVKGTDVVQEIEEVDTDENYKPKTQLLIFNVTLKRDI